MRIFYIILVSMLAFNFTYCQSKIIGNSHSNNLPSPSGNQLEPVFQPKNEFANDMSESVFSARKTDFQPGVLITKEGDTLGGLVQYGYPVPFDKVSYKANELGSDSLFSVHEIKSLITRYVYLANIPFAGKEKLMPWLSVGKINLYFYQKFYGTGFTEGIYVLEKNNQFTYINKKDFKVMMRHVFFDVPDLLKKLGKKGYRFDNLVGIVKEYNKRFQ